MSDLKDDNTDESFGLPKYHHDFLRTLLILKSKKTYHPTPLITCPLPCNELEEIVRGLLLFLPITNQPIQIDKATILHLFICNREEIIIRTGIDQFYLNDGYSFKQPDHHVSTSTSTSSEIKKYLTASDLMSRIYPKNKRIPLDTRKIVLISPHGERASDYVTPKSLTSLNNIDNISELEIPQNINEDSILMKIRASLAKASKISIYDNISMKSKNHQLDEICIKPCEFNDNDNHNPSIINQLEKTSQTGFVTSRVYLTKYDPNRAPDRDPNNDLKSSNSIKYVRHGVEECYILNNHPIITKYWLFGKQITKVKYMEYLKQEFKNQLDNDTTNLIMKYLTN